VAQLEEGVFISERQYALDIIEEIANCKFIGSPMDPSQKRTVDQAEIFSDPERCKRWWKTSFILVLQDRIFLMLWELLVNSCRILTLIIGRL